MPNKRDDRAKDVVVVVVGRNTRLAGGKKRVFHNLGQFSRVVCEQAKKNFRKIERVGSQLRIRKKKTVLANTISFMIYNISRFGSASITR